MARKYFSIPFLTVRGRTTPPPVSSSGQARIYYNSSASTFYASSDGYDYEVFGQAVQGDPGTPGTQGADGYTGDTVITLAAGDATELAGSTLVGGGFRDSSVWSSLSFVTLGFTNRATIGLTVQLWDATLMSEIASHSHTAQSTSSQTTVVVVPNDTMLEVRISLTGTLSASDAGTLVSAVLKGVA